MNTIIMITVIIYFIVGLFFADYYFKKWYGEEYYLAKIKGEVEPGMVSIQLLIMTVFWPVLVIKDIIDNI